MDERRFRFDLLVALLALLISGVAAFASAYQTYVIRQQFSATVWPYVTFVSTSSTDSSFELDVSNAGIGPALIRRAVVTRDGKIMPESGTPGSSPALTYAIEPERVAAQRDERRAKAHGTSSASISSISRGDVVPAGGKVQLLRVSGRYLARRVISDMRHLDVELCYCSLLGTCWTQRWWDSSDGPHAVRSCG